MQNNTINWIENLSLAFAAGCLGAVANSLLVWGGGQLGVTAALGVKIAPTLTKGWLYPRIVWGGIWGLALVLPFMKSAMLRGLVISLAATAITLFVVFPSKGKGVMGIELGMLTPLFPLIFNGVWGIVAGAWYGQFRKKDGEQDPLLQIN